MTSLVFILLFIVIQFEYVISFTKFNIQNTRSNIVQVNLFNFFNPKKADTNQVASAPVTASKSTKSTYKLEKISNTQNRDYKAEAEQNKVVEKKRLDKQKVSYNYKKSDEFPNLYGGWIKAEGDQIAKQLVKATKSALSSKEKYIEILFDPVPNLDEVAFGTLNNKIFRLELSENLKVPDYVTNRGGPATLEWSNIYWANRLAENLGKQNIVALSISGNGIPISSTSKAILPTLHKSLSLMLLSDAMKPNSLLISNVVKADLLIILSPCEYKHYNDAKILADKLNIPVIALNAPYSYIYDVGGGSPFNLAYVMKRIPKGWVFRMSPKPFEIIIEGPDYEISRVAQVSKRPTLPEMTQISMSKSAEMYGSIGNDRIFANRL